MPQALPEDVPVVRARTDRTGQSHTVPQVESRIDFKVLTAETGGSLFVLENRDMVRGGPPRHVHPAQDEWFYLIEGGELAIEIGDRVLRLKPGDSVLAPRNVPHVWAYAGDTPGRMIVAFTPAGTMEDFFAQTTAPGAVADPKVFETHGMRVVGPPLRV
jgi:mannose-6-phosphate isomerase-like protein (cupin superfamily)